MLDVANPECSMRTREEFARITQIARDSQGINKMFAGIRSNRANFEGKSQSL